MNENHTTANGDLRNRELAVSIFAEVVRIVESRYAVGVENLSGCGAVVFENADLVLHDGVVALTNAADVPTD